jgi:hypothetical protein
LNIASEHGPSVIAKFLTAACPCRLKQLSLELRSATAPVLPPIFGLLSTYCSSTLQSLRLHVVLRPESTFFLTRDAFQLLFDLRCLKELAITGAVLSLGDIEFEKIATAWPQLGLLQLTTRLANNELADSTIILRGLASLLSNCENFKELELRIERKWNDIRLQVLDKCGVCNQKIVRLYEIWGLFSTDVPRTLAKMLPDLCVVDAYDSRRYHARSRVTHEASESTAHRSPQNITEPEND